jgi:hypothetical protein
MGFYDDIVSDSVAPPWLQQGAYQQGAGVGGRILQTWGKELDTIATRARQAAVVSMPGVGDPSAIPLLCADRLIIQGSSETTGQITVRLTAAFDSWKTAGGDWAVLAQILGLFRGFPNAIPPGRIVGGGYGADSIRWSYWATTPPVITIPPLHTPPMGNWLWDFDVEYTGLGPNVSPWYRFWLILDSYGSYSWCGPNQLIGAGGFKIGDGTAIGFNISPAIFVAMRTLLRNWQAAGAWCRWIIVNLNAPNTFYSPDNPNAEPDGTWGKPAKLQAGSPPVWVPARDANSRFCDGMAVGN